MILLVYGSQSAGLVTNKVHCKLQKKERKVIQKYPTRTFATLQFQQMLTFRNLFTER